MRLDHIAYRVTDRHKTAEFLRAILDYSKSTEFQIEFDDKSTAQCVVLEPFISGQPEVFISNGSPGSIVDKWVKERNGGGVHHIAYSTGSIEEKVEEWKAHGIEFLTENIIDCPEDDMRQIFTKPIDYLGGIIIELIDRGDKGFCQNNVKNLMNSTKGL
tara:strand:+ start:35 stop:511 length:477 start_codon:yes stop_codon:yes gene_type:complete